MSTNNEGQGKGKRVAEEPENKTQVSASIHKRIKVSTEQTQAAVHYEQTGKSEW